VGYQDSAIGGLAKAVKVVFVLRAIYRLSFKGNIGPMADGW
jgi:hypothetical protein